MDRRLTSILKGDEQPGDDSVELARLALRTRRYAAACALYAEAFARAPGLGADLASGDRYNAACAAALAAAGRDRDAASPGEDLRAGWRKRSLGWLSDELAAWAVVGERGEAEALERLRETLAHWKTDPDLASLREPGDLEHLPGAVRDECLALWARVDALLARARVPG
jgi:hypothetical protein